MHSIVYHGTLILPWTVKRFGITRLIFAQIAAILTAFRWEGLPVPEKCAAIIDMLIERRHNQGMTQKELAEAASLTLSVIARLESKRAMPQLDTLMKVAEALGCDLKLVELR